MPNQTFDYLKKFINLQKYTFLSKIALIFRDQLDGLDKIYKKQSIKPKMSKKSPSKNNPLSPSDEVYQVEKIINQRISDGKKEYKVIWKGYAFEQATWEPEENLSCPEKINQFLKRYQDVIKRKNLLNKNPNEQVDARTTPERVQSGMAQQQKLLSSHSPAVSKQKVQTSMQKGVTQTSRKTPDIENLKSKIMTPQYIQSTKPTEQSRAQFTKQTPSLQSLHDINANIPQAHQPKLNIPPSQSTTSKDLSLGRFQEVKSNKVQPIYQPSQKTEVSIDKILNKLQLKTQHQNGQRLASHEALRKQQPERHQANKRAYGTEYRVGEFPQQQKISSMECEAESTSEQSQSQPLGQQLFLNVTERLDIQRIFGVVNFANQPDELHKKQAVKIISELPTLFLVKNKFSEKEKIVSRSRIINQEPLKLIQFYETLLTE